MNQGGSRHLSWRLVFASSLGMLVLAALLLPHSPGMGDSAELTIALALAGVPHPTGYPLYVLFGHGFVLAAHALGISWVVAANLWSAAGAAVAIGAMVRVGQHLAALATDDPRLPAPRGSSWATVLLPAAALALHPAWIDTATVAEVYSWHHALLGLSAALLLGWLRELGESERGATDEVRRAALWGLLAGAACTMHATAMFFLAPMSVALVAALVRARRWRPRLALIAIGASLFPLAAYGWLAWRARHPAAFQWPIGSSLTALWMHVRGAAYSHFLGGFAPSASQWGLIRGVLLPWILPGIGLGTVLALRMPSRPLRWGLLSLLVGAAIQVVFIVSYGVPDPEAYFVPPLMVSVIASMLAIDWLARRMGPVVAWCLALVLVIVSAAGSIPRSVRLRDELAKTDAEFRAAWRSIPPDRGIVLWADDHYHRFVLLQVLEHQRPEVYVDNPEMLVWPARRRAFRARFGFDPLEGLDLRSPAFLERIPGNIQRRTTVPTTVLAESPPR